MSCSEVWVYLCLECDREFSRDRFEFWHSSCPFCGSDEISALYPADLSIYGDSDDFQPWNSLDDF